MLVIIHYLRALVTEGCQLNLPKPRVALVDRSTTLRCLRLLLAFQASRLLCTRIRSTRSSLSRWHLIFTQRHTLRDLASEVLELECNLLITRLICNKYINRLKTSKISKVLQSVARVSDNLRFMVCNLLNMTQSKTWKPTLFIMARKTWWCRFPERVMLTSSIKVLSSPFHLRSSMITTCKVSN